MKHELQEHYSGDLSFRDLVGIFKRQWPLTLITVVLFVALAAAYTATQPAKYRSTARVLIENNPARSGGQGDPLSIISYQEAIFDVPTQIQIMQSPQILNDAAVQAQLLPPQTQGQLESAPSVDVKSIGDTGVLEINVDSQNPEHTKKLADALPTVFGRYIQSRQRDALSRAIAYLNRRIQEENAELAKAQTELVNFRKRYNVVDSNTEMGIRVSFDSAAQAQVAQAETAVQAALARLQELELQRASLPQMIEQPSTVQSTAELEQEKGNLDRLLASRRQLLLTYTENSLAVRKIDEQIASQRQYIENLQKRLLVKPSVKNPQLDALDAQIVAARAELKSARAQLSSAQSQAARRSSSLMSMQGLAKQQAALESKVLEREQTIRRLTATVDDLTLRDNALKTPVSVVMAASEPVKIAPKPQMNLIVGALFGLVFGLMLAMARDTLQDRVASDRDAKYVSGLDILARLPVIKRASPLVARSGDPLALDRYRLLRSNMALAHEYHKNGTGLVRAAEDVETVFDGDFHPTAVMPYNDLKAVMITSTFAGEGKSVVAANLATAMALDGKSVILVDANLRMPTVHRSFGVDQVPGLTEVLTGEKTIEEVIQDSPIQNLRVVPAGTLPSNPSGLIASDAMKHTHEALTGMADVVIYDTVSSFALADSQALAAIVGMVLFVTKVGGPKKDDMREAISTLKMTKARILGIVVNKDPSARVVLS
ncbi:MAG: polysaccharide biosynthesis tyrosine autokinase [Fimbriimonadales bacterium]|nr:polysaccharide biosynthesis tyrosine autokinase [Fimbriimonadales bacterium]